MVERRRTRAKTSPEDDIQPSRERSKSCASRGRSTSKEVSTENVQEENKLPLVSAREQKLVSKVKKHSKVTSSKPSLKNKLVKENISCAHNNKKGLPIGYYVILLFILVFAIAHSITRTPYEHDETNTTAPHYFEHLPILTNYKPGTLNSSFAYELFKDLPSSVYSDDVNWFISKVSFQEYKAHDGTTLQSYKIKHEIKQKKSFAIVFSTGFSETIVKYASVIKQLHEMGGDVYSFDLRGQGFSQTTGWNDGRITHIDSFSDYTKDLQDFVENVVRKESKVNSFEQKDLPVIYMGNSLGGLIGYQSHNKFKGNHALFDKLILVVPCIQPSVITLKHSILIEVLYWIVPNFLSDTLLVRIDYNLAKFDLNTSNAIFATFWDTMKNFCSRQLIFAGPSMRWLREVYRSGIDTYTNKGSPAVDNTDILVFTATNDTRVRNDMIEKFYEFISDGNTPGSGYLPHLSRFVHPHRSKEQNVINSNLQMKTQISYSHVKATGAVRRHVKFLDTRHELLTEPTYVLEAVLSEVQQFLSNVYKQDSKTIDNEFK
jgi:alpha-beta hydrolase superfamily lysophospholipase